MDTLRVRDVAEYLGVSQSLVYSLVAEKRLKAIRLGRSGRRGTIRVKKEDLETFVAQTREDLADD